MSQPKPPLPADAHKVIDVARGLEGLRRQDGIHAAAVVITREPLTEYLPIQRKPEAGGKIEDAPIVTQYEMHGVEDLGLLKMDFLGLRNLDVLEIALELIEHSTGRRPRLVREKGSGRASERPAHDRAEERHCRRLRNRHQLYLPAPASEPGQPLSRRLDIASHADGREHGEREQERRDLAPDEQKPAPGDLPRLARRSELGHGSG